MGRPGEKEDGAIPLTDCRLPTAPFWFYERMGNLDGAGFGLEKKPSPGTPTACVSLHKVPARPPPQARPPGTKPPPRRSSLEKILWDNLRKTHISLFF